MLLIYLRDVVLFNEDGTCRRHLDVIVRQGESIMINDMRQGRGKGRRKEPYCK